MLAFVLLCHDVVFGTAGSFNCSNLIHFGKHDRNNAFAEPIALDLGLHFSDLCIIGVWLLLSAACVLRRALSRVSLTNVLPPTMVAGSLVDTRSKQGKDQPCLNHATWQGSACSNLRVCGSSKDRPRHRQFSSAVHFALHLSPAQRSINRSAHCLSLKALAVMCSSRLKK